MAVCLVLEEQSASEVFVLTLGLKKFSHCGLGNKKQMIQNKPHCGLVYKSIAYVAMRDLSIMQIMVSYCRNTMLLLFSYLRHAFLQYMQLLIHANFCSND